MGLCGFQQFFQSYSTNLPVFACCNDGQSEDQTRLLAFFFLRLTNLPEAPRPPPVPLPPPWTFRQPPRDPHFGVAATAGLAEDDPYHVLEDVESEYDDETLQQHLLKSTEASGLPAETKEEIEEDKNAEHDDYQDVCSPTSIQSTSSKSSKRTRRRSGSRSRSPRRRRRRSTSTSSCDLEELVGSLEKLAQRRRREIPWRLVCFACEVVTWEDTYHDRSIFELQPQLEQQCSCIHVHL